MGKCIKKRNFEHKLYRKVHTYNLFLSAFISQFLHLIIFLPVCFTEEPNRKKHKQTKGLTLIINFSYQVIF